MASLKHETILTVTSEDMRQTLTDEFCRYGLLGDLVVSAIRLAEGGDFELTLSPTEQDAAPQPSIRVVSA